MALQRLPLGFVLATSIAAACAEHDSEKYARYRDELGSAYPGSTHEQFVDLGQSSLDQSCLIEGKTQIIGLATERDIQALFTFARARWPDESIFKVAVTPRIAMVETGARCGLLVGSGHTIFFESDPIGSETNWTFSMESNWIG